jgi:hypothetical protein
MGWRDAFVRVLEDGEPNGLTYGHCQQVADALLAMPPTNRIALARELLANTGRVVAREVGESDDTGPNATTAAMVHGWNACRAAMLGEGE